MTKINYEKVIKVSNLFIDLFVKINNNVSYFEALLGLIYSSKIILKVSTKIGIIDDAKVIEIDKNMNETAEKNVCNIDKLVTLIESLKEEVSGSDK